MPMVINGIVQAGNGTRSPLGYTEWKENKELQAEATSNKIQRIILKIEGPKCVSIICLREHVRMIFGGKKTFEGLLYYLASLFPLYTSPFFY